MKRIISHKLQKNFWKQELSIKNSIFVVLSLLPIFYGVIRNGHSDFNTSVVILIIVADIIAIIGNNKFTFNSYWKGLMICVAIIALEIPIQILLYGNKYYGRWSAIWGCFTILITIVSIPIIIKKQYGILIWKLIEFVGLFNALLIIIQSVGRVFGIRLDQMGRISDLFFNAWEFQGGAFFRACGMFCEPSQFAEIGLLSLFFCLFIDNNKRKSIIIGIALMLSTSSLGILGVPMLLILYVLGIDRFSNVKKSVKLILVLLTLFIIIGVTWWASESRNIVFQRVFSGGSASVRTMRSFEIFTGMDVPSKFLGIGLQNQELYLNYNHIILKYDNYETMSINREFAQTFGYLLCTTGIIGILGFVMQFCKMAWKSKWSIKSLLILFLAVCLTCCILMRSAFLLYLLAIYALLDYENNVLI